MRKVYTVESELMAGSEKKHLKHNVKSKSPESDAEDKKPMRFNFGHSLGQTSEFFCGASRSLKDDNRKLCPMTSCWARHSKEDPEFSEYIRVLLNSRGDERIALVSDLINTVRNLEEKVKERKKWAQEIVTHAETLAEKQRKMNRLRMEVDKIKRENEYKFAEIACNLKLLEMEQSVRVVWTEACLRTSTCKRLENENAQIKAKLEVSKLELETSKRNLKNIKNRERKKRSKVKKIEEEKRFLQAQFDEEELKKQKLQLKLLHVEKAAKEAEMRLTQASQEKNQKLTMLSEEKKMAEMEEANTRAKLSQLQQYYETKNQLVEEKRGRLENQLSSLRLSIKVGDRLLYESPEAVAFTSRAFQESSTKTDILKRLCMMCSRNELSVVFLPCAHLVVCFQCHGGKFDLTGEVCPHCHREIEQAIRVHGRSTRSRRSVHYLVEGY